MNNKWLLFIISIGFLFIASSPIFSNPYLQIGTGIVLCLAGIILVIRDNKKRKDKK